jgi:translocation and assembly module TamB
MRRLILSLACLAALALPVHAQDDDRGRLITFLESQLSDGADRQVRIDGFRGALSSEAELDRLSISDADGEWLVLEDARLNWRRLALLSGRLEVEALTAQRLTVTRPPLPPEGPDLPTPEATPFALPELPVSINIGDVAIEEVVLGEPVIGLPATLSVSGAAQLADGSGSAVLDLRRLDGPEGRFTLQAGFDNATRVLALDLSLQEAEGGLTAELLDLPGAPSVGLTVSGEGPLDDIDIDVGLSTDGVERLDGYVRSTRIAEASEQRIDIALDGDLTPLMAEEYRAFFGQGSALSARITREDSGATRLQDMRLASAALLLEGDLSLDAAARPTIIDVTGRVTPPDGAARIVLPVPGADTSLAAADLAVAFDAAADEAFTVSATLDDLRAGDLSITDARIAADGRIEPSETGIARLLADLDMEFDGIDHDTPALAEALGPALGLSARADWNAGGAFQLSDIALAAGDITASGDVAMDTGDGTLPVTFDLDTIVADLSRFSGLSGQSLNGALQAGLTGDADALSGAFDILLTGTGRDLRAAPAVPDALLAGETTLRLEASRDGEGVRIETLTLDGTQVSLDASGDLSSEGGGLTATARLEDLGLLTSAVRGPATVRADIASAAEGWEIDADLAGPGGLNARADGRVGLEGGRVDLDVQGGLPLALANRFISPRSITGQLRFDLGITGQPGLDAVSGRITTTGARVVAPTFRVVLEDVALDASISGGRVSFDGNGAVSTGGRMGVSGTIDVGGPGVPGSVDVRLDGVRLVDPTLYTILVSQGALSVTGPLAVAPRVAGRIDLGESELRVPETGLGSAPPIPEITHVGESAPQRQTRAAAGLLRSQSGSGGSGAVGLDIQINAPGRIFLRGRGIDAEFGGAIRIAGNSAAVIPSGQFELLRGRISILGTRLDLTEGSATLQGDFDPFLRLRAESRAGGYRIIIAVEGPASSPDISLSSDPFLPEDEVLAQLLFGRSVSALSPVQLLQLADAASSLAGGSTNGGILSNLREGLGLDDLDLQTDDEGNAAVRAGRYLSDNVYTDVTIGAEGESELSLNIDLTPDITARGSFSSDGGSGIGVFFERDY